MIDEPQLSFYDESLSDATLPWPAPRREPDAKRVRDGRTLLRPVNAPTATVATDPDIETLGVGEALSRLAAEVPAPLLPVVLALGCTIRFSTEAGEDLARLLNRVTEHLLGVGGPCRAVAVAELSFAATRSHLGADHPATLDALANLAVCYQSAARGADALVAFDQVLADRERLRRSDDVAATSRRPTLPADPALEPSAAPRSLPPGSRRVTKAAFFSGRSLPSAPPREDEASARGVLAQCLDRQGRVDVTMAVQVLAADGPPALRPAVRTVGRAILSLTDAVEDLATMVNRVTAHLSGAGGAYRPTEITAAAAAAVTAHLGAEHPHALRARANLAISNRMAGRNADALVQLEALLGDVERLHGPEHPETLAVLGHLATSYQADGRLTEARGIFERVAAERDRLLGPAHPDTLTARTQLATCHHAAGRRASALGHFERIAADCERLLGPEHPDTLNTLSNVAAAYQSAGRLAESLALYERVLVDLVRLLGPDHPETLAARSELAVSYQSAGRTARALASFGRVLADRARLLGPEHPRTLDARFNLAVALRAANRPAEALVLLQRLVGECERVVGPDDERTLTALAHLGACHRAAGRTADALSVFERVAGARERLLGPEHPKTLVAESRLAIAYQAVGRTAKALALGTRVLADCERVLGADHRATAAVRALTSRQGS